MTSGGHPGERPRLVALRALGLGDFLCAVPALRALARAFPDHERVVAMPAPLAPLAPLTGAVDRVVDTGPLAPLDPSLDRADVLVNLHGAGPQSHRVALRARPRRFLAFAHPEVPASGGMPAWQADEHERRRWCRLVHEGLGTPADPDDVLLDAPPADVLPAAPRGATVLHPGAAYRSRHWPSERWAAVARAEADAGRAVIVTGGPDEVALAREVASRAGLASSAVVAGRTSTLELAALVARASRILSADTGIAHLAVAYGRPSVTLFGPVPPALWGPPPDRPQHRVLWAGRSGDPFAARPDPGLLAITVDDVLAALAALPDLDEAA